MIYSSRIRCQSNASVAALMSCTPNNAQNCYGTCVHEYNTYLSSGCHRGDSWEYPRSGMEHSRSGMVLYLVLTGARLGRPDALLGADIPEEKPWTSVRGVYLYLRSVILFVILLVYSYTFLPIYCRTCCSSSLLPS